MTARSQANPGGEPQAGLPGSSSSPASPASPSSPLSPSLLPPGAARPARSPRTAQAVALLAASLVAFAVLWASRPVPMPDLLVYRAEGAAAAAGRDLYGFRATRWQLPATYPPFAALLFVPLARLPLSIARGAVVAADLVLLAALVHLSVRLAGKRSGVAVVAVGTALGLWLEPVFQTVVFGQINLALAVLALWDLTRPDGARGKGLALGLAAGIKITPALFAVHLALTGRLREAGRAVAGFAGTVLIGTAVLPGASVDFWTTRLYQTDRVGRPWIVDNQSLRGFAARALHTPAPGALWVAAALATGVAGLAVAALAHRRGRPALGLVCAAVTGLLVSPVSWSHHWVWCVPLIALLPARLAVATALAFTARTLWLVPHGNGLDLHRPWWQQPLAAPYPLIGLTLLTAAGVRLRRSATP